MQVKWHRKVGGLLASVSACLGFIVLPLLPRRAVLWLSRALGRMGYSILPYMRRVAFSNLDTAFGDSLTAGQKEAIVRQVFGTSALVLLDFFWFILFTKRRLRRYVKFDPSFECCFDLSPLIGVTAHLGNWEIMGDAVALRGCPYISIARPLRNRFLHMLLMTLRARGGQQIVWKSGAVRSLLRILQQGGRTGLLMDQNTVPRDGGIYVSFFGLPAPISKIVHLLASKSGAKVVFVYCTADEKGNYTISALPPFSVDEGPYNSTIAVTQHIASQTESVIREHPGQWMWMYRRWRYIPPGVSSAGYPFYAKKIPPAFMGRHQSATGEATGEAACVGDQVRRE